MGRRPEMCVVGFGRMGRRAAEVFGDGFRVQVVSRRDVEAELDGLGAVQAPSADAALRLADVVALTVPVEQLGTWVPRINALTPATCAVLECCTARGAAARALAGLERPSFGLPELGAASQPVIGTPDPRVAAWLAERGATLAPTSADAYDGETHAGTAQFLAIALQTFLEEDDRDRLARSPAGAHLVRLLRHLETNSPATYYETQVLNPNLSAARKRLIAHLVCVDGELDAGRFPFEPAPPSARRP